MTQHIRYTCDACGSECNARITAYGTGYENKHWCTGCAVRILAYSTCLYASNPEVEAACAELRAALVERETELAEARAREDEMVKRASDLADELAEAHREFERLQDESANGRLDAEVRVRMAEEERDAALQRVMVADVEIDRANEENARLYKVLEESREANEQTQVDRDAALQHAAEAEERITELRRGVDALKIRCADLKAALHNTHADHEEDEEVSRRLVIELLGMLGKKARKRHKKRLREIRLAVDGGRMTTDLLDEIESKRGPGAS